MKRDPLDGTEFMKSSRQWWCAIFIGYSFVVMGVQVFCSVDPTPYMNFALTIGSLFVLGGSVDSFLKINAAKTIKVKEMDKGKPADD